MLSKPLEDMALFARKVLSPLRRPEWMVFLPAVTLAAFWLGGEGWLIFMALGMPMLFALAGAFRFSGSTDGDDRADLAPPDRNSLVIRLERFMAIAASGRKETAALALLFDDLDRTVDRFGPSSRAEILAHAAERVATCLRSGDIVMPLDGMGLAVLLAPVSRFDLETAIQVSARLQATICAPMSLQGMRVHLTASAGFCLSGRAAEPTARAMFDAACLAAEEARRHGPGGIRAYGPEMALARNSRDQLRDDLETALEQGQIRAWFQPQLATDSGAISGFEALARWHHPDRGLIPPAEFLPLIFEAGLADRLGEVMLNEALTALSRWDRAGHLVPAISVNFSEGELRDPKLPERLAWELDRFGLKPDRLTIEILESVALQAEDEVLVRNVATLAKMGCGIDLDDFGTGHAAIASLRRLPIRRIKIDRSFVSRVDQDADQQKMVAAILSLAETLGLQSLAEGVETPAEHGRVAQMGCGHVQGFGIGRPMPMDETLDWIERHRARTATILRLGIKK